MDSSSAVTPEGINGQRDIFRELAENIVDTFRHINSLGIVPTMSQRLNKYGEEASRWYVGPRTRAGWVQEVKDLANKGENAYLRIAYFLTEQFGEDDEAWADWLTTTNEYLGDIPGAYIGGGAPNYLLDAMRWDRGEISLAELIRRG